MTKKIGQKIFVVKSNSLIEARYRLSLQESQVVLWLLTQIDSKDEDFKAHKLDIISFARLNNVTVDSKYSELRKITKRLMQRIMEIKDEKQNRIIQLSWLSSAIYEIKKGYINLKFDPELKPYLLQLKSHFTKIDIADILNLKSIYAVRIFELLLQYLLVSKRIMTIIEIRNYLCIEEDEYLKYSHLKEKVFNRAKNEINLKTEYNVNYQEIKESRKVVAIEWTITKKSLTIEENSKKITKIQKELRSKDVIIEALLEYGFRKPTSKKLLENHGEEVIKNALRAVDLQIQRHHAKNPKAMLQTAIQEKWHPEIFKKQRLKK